MKDETKAVSIVEFCGLKEKQTKKQQQKDET